MARAGQICRRTQNLLRDRYTRAIARLRAILPAHPYHFLKRKRGVSMASNDFPKTPKEFFDYAKKHQAEMVDVKFVDMLGSWQHCSFPVDHLDEGTFEEGLGFDG